jgi:hypothetical protein
MIKLQTMSSSIDVSLLSAYSEKGGHFIWKIFSFERAEDSMKGKLYFEVGGVELCQHEDSL